MTVHYPPLFELHCKQYAYTHPPLSPVESSFVIRVDIIISSDFYWVFWFCFVVRIDTTSRRLVHVLRRLPAESVEGLSLPLEGIDDIHGGDRLPARMLSVGDRVADDVLKEDLEDAAGLLVDEAGDALDSPPASKAADRGLGDALDVVAQHLPVALSAALAKTLATLAATRHVVRGERGEEVIVRRTERRTEG